MEMDAISGIGKLSGVTPKMPAPALPLNSGKSFKEIKSALNVGKPEGDLFTQIEKAKNGILSGKELSQKDLLLYQKNAQEMGMRVELLSKVSESMLSAARKFQNPQ